MGMAYTDDSHVDDRAGATRVKDTFSLYQKTGGGEVDFLAAGSRASEFAWARAAQRCIMNTRFHQTTAIRLASLIFGSIPAHGATVLATLNSQDQIVGARQSSGATAPGYYTDQGAPTVGVSGGGTTRVNQNAVVGFTLPTLNLGESISAAEFAITVLSVSTSTTYTVALFGLETTDPDGSGTTFYSQSGTGAINASFTNTNAVPGSIPTADVTAFIQSFYIGNTPIQSEVFFRLNQTQTLGTTNTRRISFTGNSATLTLTTIPEPGAGLLGGLGLLVLLRRRR